MREIKELACDIKRELKQAYKYACEAVKHKEQYHDLAQDYYRLASDALDHVDTLHKEAVAMIDKAKRSDVEIPKAMTEIWNWYHDLMIEDQAEVRRLLDMYKA